MSAILAEAHKNIPFSIRVLVSQLAGDVHGERLDRIGIAGALEEHHVDDSLALAKDEAASAHLVSVVTNALEIA